MGKVNLIETADRIEELSAMAARTDDETTLRYIAQQVSDHVFDVVLYEVVGAPDDLLETKPKDPVPPESALATIMGALTIFCAPIRPSDLTMYFERAAWCIRAIAAGRVATVGMVSTP